MPVEKLVSCEAWSEAGVGLNSLFYKRWLFACLLSLSAGGTFPKHILVAVLGRNMKSLEQ